MEDSPLKLLIIKMIIIIYQSQRSSHNRDRIPCIRTENLFLTSSKPPFDQSPENSCQQKQKPYDSICRALSQTVEWIPIASLLSTRTDQSRRQLGLQRRRLS